MGYKVVLLERVRTKLLEIKGYISENYSEDSAKRKVDEILRGIQTLEVFPEIGLDAEVRLGKEIDPRHKTRLLTLKRDYIVLYYIDEGNVYVTHLLPTKSDYLRLFE